MGKGRDRGEEERKREKRGGTSPACPFRGTSGEREQEWVTLSLKGTFASAYTLGPWAGQTTAWVRPVR